MGAPARGELVLVNFPFTDLTGRKLRPTVVVAAGDHCDDISYARPRKLFTANDSLITRVVGKLNASKLDEVAQAVIKAISGN